MFIVYGNYSIKFLYKNVCLSDSLRLLLFLSQMHRPSTGACHRLLCLSPYPADVSLCREGLYLV